MTTTTNTTPLFVMLANAAAAWRVCYADETKLEWADRHADRLHYLVREWLPRGSGFDAGTEIDLDECKPDRLVFTTSFHHMDAHGGYAGWTEHTVTVTPIFGGIAVKVSGRDKRGIKDYIADTFHDALTARYDATVQLSRADIAAGY